MGNENSDEKIAIKRFFSRDSSNENLSKKCQIPKRYILSFMGFLGFCNLYCMRTNLSVAIVAMVSNYTVLQSGTNVTKSDFQWDSQTRGLLLASFFWGYAITQLPGGWLASCIGGRNLYGAGVLSTGILTLLTPVASYAGFQLLIVVRFLEGLFEGVTYPSMHTIWSKWAPPLECSKLSSFSLSGSYFGMMLALPVSGLLAHFIRWEAIFYFFGTCALVWVVLWFMLITEYPEEHPSITPQELNYLNETIGMSYMQKQKFPIPWKSLFTSLPLYAITVSHFSENWGFYTMMTELPTFLNDLVDYNLYQIGMLSAIPYLVMSITIICGGQLADYLRSKRLLSTVAVRKVFNCTAFLCQALLITTMTFIMTPASVVICLTLAIGMGGFAWSGFSANMLDIAPQASIVMGISNTFASIPGIIAPVVAGSIVQNNALVEWKMVFLLIAVIYLFGAIFYGIFASSKLQQWAEPKIIDIRDNLSTAPTEYELGHEEIK
ncbi:hypothetical protein HELRODRAFT_65417 [Helobdella robusta]|uniref:Sialin n=1 Tax=Helobdella robusta TaxID=6412 RepID=T1FY75_HELRO|nr:hypothetical protein HELRODRAFT_65417 [Helobdella robusta]ESO02282.1 hypothetical protein HELRODRAFT_65417 [Helobdella robusta]